MHRSERLLRSYRKDQARIAYLEMEASQLIENPDQVIEGMVFSNWGAKDPTSYAALRYRDQAAREHSLLVNEILHLKRRIRQTEGLLQALGERERKMATAHYIHGHPWKEVVRRYTKDMPGPGGKAALQGMRADLLEKMQRAGI